MKSVCRDIFKAIHEGKWMKIEYRNYRKEITKYWIGIRDLDPVKRTISVDGLHLTQLTTESYDRIYIDSILSSEIIEGTYCKINTRLVEDIAENPDRYRELFDSVSNLKVLNYLENCYRLDNSPYVTEYELLRYFDGDKLQSTDDEYPLTDEQFRQIVSHFQYHMNRNKPKERKLHIKRLVLNVLSVQAREGLYMLAYRELFFDVKDRVFRPDEDITVCTQFTINGNQQSIRRFLDADEYELLDDFEQNLERIKDAIAAKYPGKSVVDDQPYIVGLDREIMLDLHKEYKAILEMYENDKVTFPMKAFFGNLLDKPRRTKAYPIALLNNNINVDQLLAINHAMKYPLAYVQGPPGTGKTNTIINTLVTAFFNNKSVLFASYNNIPIDNVYDRLCSLTYQGKRIPFPVLRLGNMEKVRAAIDHINELRSEIAFVKIFATTLDKRKDDRMERAKRLSNRLKEYEEVLDLKERRDTLSQVVDYQQEMRNMSNLMAFQVDLQGRQLEQINRRIEEIGAFSDEEALQLLDRNEEEFYQYLYYSSARLIKQLEEPKYEELREILDAYGSREEQTRAFNQYLQKSENVRKLQRVFPIMITTCISASRIGDPEPLFDMTVMDEASQCNVAISLVPILRGDKLMLVGDPQQLTPVILLDELTNRKLRRRYHVTDEYDYRQNSIYKTFLACDSVSDEVLLRNHYRCNESIIGFNNRKYYHSKLNVLSESQEEQPLVFLDVRGGSSRVKNTAPAEVEQVLEYAQMNKDKDIAVITPFVNQRELIERGIKERGIENLVCGTVHAFQGDEKDVVLFSTALSEKTSEGTYHWLMNNKELINVATSRAKDKLVVLADGAQLERLHQGQKDDDLYELVQYMRTNGASQVTEKQVSSRALGVQPFSTATESAFLRNLTHALENIWLSQSKYVIHREVEVSEVFEEKDSCEGLFYMGQFDFVVYQKQGETEIPMLAIELDGKEHVEDEVVKERDRQKKQICEAHQMQLIRVENSYARRYQHIKRILFNYFSKMH